MKFSLAWIFDHISGISWQNLAIQELIEQFNETTAEIEVVYPVHYKLELFTLARVVQRKDRQLVCSSAEWKDEFVLPDRSDARVGAFFLVKKERDKYRFATMQDFHSEKNMLLPELFCPDEAQKGEWKNACDASDYLLVVDNNAISHRPDLWGHRGMAREIAVRLGASLVQEECLLMPCIIRSYAHKTLVSAKNPIEFAIEDPAFCTRLAGMYIKNVVQKPSLPWVSQRLSAVDARPLNAVIDATNYVMYDLGHPIHAFDARTLASPCLSARLGRAGEKLSLLDSETITLTANDCVISDGTQPISLAGVMGGLESGVGQNTRDIVLEAAHFNPVAIRRTSIHHKKRTEASSRFEKGLDPNQNTVALMRFLYLLTSWGVSYQDNQEIVSIGLPSPQKTIVIAHESIIKKMGIPVAPEVVTTILKRLGLGVQKEEKDHVVWYTITVPTHRPDLTIPEDIVEEVARFVGYSSLPKVLPDRPSMPVDNRAVFRLRDVKYHCAFGLGMHELSSYSLYDEEFLRTLAWDPTDAVFLENPLSEYAKRLVTSLVPNALKALSLNRAEDVPLRFFEWARIWRNRDSAIQGSTIQEMLSLALVWYDPGQPSGQNTGCGVDFYAIKAQLSSLFDLLGMPVVWQQTQGGSGYPWYHPHQTAIIMHDNVSIGCAGKMNPSMLRSVVHGDAFIAELSGDFLLSWNPPTPVLKPLSKYPKVQVDISLFVRPSQTVRELEHLIGSTDTRISDVRLIDFYDKIEESGQRSATFRYTIGDPSKTLNREEIDSIAQTVADAVRKTGACVR